MSQDDFDDLLGDPDDVRLPAKPLPKISEFQAPVARAFLAQVFQMEPRTVTKRLARLEPIAFDRGQDNRPLYDFVEAASYLIKPSFSLAEYIKTLRIQDLPPHLSAQISQAMLHRQTYETRAKNLWGTESVLDVLRETFLLFRTQMQLLPETMRENCPDLSDDHIDRIRQLCDDLQQQLYESLLELPQRRQTRSSLYDSELKPLEANEGSEPDDDE